MIDAAVRSKTPLFGFIGSSTMYPDVSHPVNEDEAYDAEPHKLYRGVGWMKRYVEQVIRYYQDISETKFGVVRTTAIYGPHDAFNENGHAIPQLSLKADAGMNPFEVWGDGTQTRDFIYVDDVVDVADVDVDVDVDEDDVDVDVVDEVDVVDVVDAVDVVDVFPFVFRFVFCVYKIKNMSEYIYQRVYDYFELLKRDTTIAQEFLAGTNSFLAVSYILFVNPYFPPLH
jgi:nucleoside-diphosphate-sugar epimerase